MSLERYGSNQPARRAVNDLEEIYERASRSEKNELDRRVRKDLFEQQLQAAVVAIRMSNSYKLNQMKLEMNIKVADQIWDSIQSTDNPLQQRVLMRQFEEWERNMNGILGY